MSKKLFFILVVIVCVAASASAGMPGWKAQATATAGNVVADDTGYTFDGTAGIDFDYGDLTTGTGATIELIFDVTDTGAVSTAIAAVPGGSTNPNGYKLDQWNRQGVFGMTVPGVGDYTFNGAPSAFDAFTHAVFVNRADGQYELYINGVSMGTGSRGGSWVTNGGLGRLGCMQSTTNDNIDVCTGTIYAVATYDNALDAGQIAALYTSTTTQASLVAPAPNGVGDVAVDAQLVWAAPGAYDPVGYRVFFGTTEPNDLEADYGLTELTSGIEDITTIDPSPAGDLDNLTTYHWVVDTYEPNAVAPLLHRGFYWSFTTITAEAKILTDNVNDQTVVAGTDATFSVGGVNVTDYQWYGPAGEIAGADSNTLTISNVQLADEGLYYCVVDNSANPSPKTSREAYLMTQRDVSVWNFENSDLADSIGDNDGTAPGPVYVGEGIVGSTSLDVTLDDPNTYVTVSRVDELNNAVSFTIEAWVKPEAITSYHAIISSRGVAEEVGVIDNGYTVYILPNGGVGFWVYNGTTNSATNTAGDFVTAGEWNYIVVTFDKGAATVYINGRQRAFGENKVMSRNITTDVYIGAGSNETENATWYYNGLIDQVRIASTILDNYAVANNYVAQFPDADICVEQTGLDYDLDGDCDVDLADFAMLVSEWLNCNRVAGTTSGFEDCR